MTFRIFIVALLSACALLSQQKVVYSDSEKPILDGIRGLRAVPDAKRGAVTTQLALDIRALPPSSPNKLSLASGLANLSTEGDFGKKTLQEVATTLSDALREHQGGEGVYMTLAQLVRYEGVNVSLTDRMFDAAMARLRTEEQERQNADFTLTDLKGRSWTLKELRGKVVLVNFWATWCPPCRKEMPDLDALYKEFREQGLVILAISDEERAKVEPFIAEHGYTYPILLDPGNSVHKLMSVEGIPKSFVYDREGKLVAQAIDMRTRGQLLSMLGRAGLGLQGQAVQ